MSEQEILEDVVRLIDESVVIDRSSRPLLPIATVIGSVRNKDRADDASRFVAELYRKYPYARLVVSGKSPVEKAAIEMCEILDMPYEVVEAGKKGDWDHGQAVQDERVVARASHIVVFDDSAHSKNYLRLAKQQRKYSQTV